MQSTEQWRPIVGYEGFYEVSDHGRARSIDRLVVAGKPGQMRPAVGRIISPVQVKSGHMVVCLWSDGHRRTASIHRLVLAAFVGPQPEGMEGCHNNGIPSDNSLTNLRWDTLSSNRLDMVTHGVHNNARKTECKRGHKLVAPNLKSSKLPMGWRECLSCSLERRTASHQSRPFDTARADLRYQDLMKATV